MAEDSLPSLADLNAPSEAQLPSLADLNAAPPSAWQKTKDYAKSVLPTPVADVYRETRDLAQSGASKLGEAFNPNSESNKEIVERTRKKGFLGSMPGNVAQSAGTVGGIATGAGEVLSSPVAGPNRALLGHALAAAPGGGSYEESKNKADTALMGIGARAALAPRPLPVAPTRPPLGVTLTEGERTGDLGLIQAEQAARRGQSGRRALQHGQEFEEQREPQLESARDEVAAGMDHPTGRIIAETPQEGGQLASAGVQRERDLAREGVDQAYTHARGLPGEIHADVFEGMLQRIRGDLTHRNEPIIVDERLTPHADAALRFLEDRVGNLQIPNRADPFGQPPQEQITGVSLQGVDQWRKTLAAYRRQAHASGNASDARATSAVVRAFDDQITGAVNGGLFTGDAGAIDAFNTARAAHAQYRATFAAGRQDPVGVNIEKVLGRGNAPPALAHQVMDFMAGATGERPTAVNVETANRIRGILGERSPEWTAVKQGLWRRFVESAEGVNPPGPGMVNRRLSNFLNGNGRDLANAMYSPQERQAMRMYADIMQQIQVPQAGANWSNTATGLLSAYRSASHSLSMIIGAAIGRATGLGLAGEAAGAGVARAAGIIPEITQLRRLRNQMPLVADQARRYQRALTAARRANTPPSRAAAATEAGRLTSKLSQVFGPAAAAVTGHAEQNEQPTPGPVGQQDGGAVVNQHPRILRASGGRVKRLHHPVQVGAQRAGDGRWYLPDPDRPGRYLEVRRYVPR